MAGSHAKSHLRPLPRRGAGWIVPGWIVSGLVPLALCAATWAGAQPAGSAGAPLWSGSAAGYRVEWTTADLRVRHGAAPLPVFSVRAQWQARAGSVGRCTGGNALALQSVVGPLLSFREQSDGQCEGSAQPWAWVRLVAVDVSRGGQPASLTDVFPEALLLEALLADKRVQEALNSGAAGPAPATLAALVQRIADYPSEDCRWGFSPDLLSRFAFHRVNRERVAVRIGLSHGCEVARGSFTQLELVLPVPPAWRDALERAGRRQGGFLMQDAPKLFGKKQTVWSFAALEPASAEAAPAAAPLRTVDWGASSFAALAPDGRLGLSSRGDGTVHVWDLDAGREVRALAGAQGRVSAVALSPDGSLAAAGWADGSVTVWNLASGSAVAGLPGNKSGVWAVALAADGRSLLAGTEDARVRLWDLRSGQEVRAFAGHTAGVRAVAFARDGRLAVSASNDRTLRVWDVDSGTALHVLKGHKGGVWGLAVSADSTLLLSGSEDMTVKLWDLATGQETLTLRGHQDRPRHVAFAPGNRLAASADDSTVKLWNLATGQALATLGRTENPITALRFAPDGRTVLAGSEDGVQVWAAPEAK